jgi:thiol-disulfide isomerase/thioredoxin
MLVKVWKKFTGSLSFAPLLIGLALGGNLLWMNVRSDDPLPAGFVQYTPAAFAAAQAAGGPIMVDVYASWCTTCKAQHAVLVDLLDDPRYDGIQGFRVDFEGDEEWVRAHRVYVQSTIIMFNGFQELNRSAGSTREAAIRGQVDAALAAIPGYAP